MTETRAPTRITLHRKDILGLILGFAKEAIKAGVSVFDVVDRGDRFGWQAHGQPPPRKRPILFLQTGKVLNGLDLWDLSVVLAKMERAVVTHNRSLKG